jgi:hypothetical protein
MTAVERADGFKTPAGYSSDDALASRVATHPGSLSRIEFDIATAQ